MNYKKYEHYIIVDEDNKPMVFYKYQLIYCQNSKTRTPLAVEIYTKNEADEVIKLSNKFRMKNNHGLTKYYLMPVKPNK